MGIVASNLPKDPPEFLAFTVPPTPAPSPTLRLSSFGSCASPIVLASFLRTIVPLAHAKHHLKHRLHSSTVTATSATKNPGWDQNKNKNNFKSEKNSSTSSASDKARVSHANGLANNLANGHFNGNGNDMDQDLRNEGGFAGIKIDPRLLHALHEMKIHEPTMVQKESIPVVYEGNSVIIHAETGSGKTLAFLLPLVQKYFIDAESPRPQSVLIIAPTRELALQITRVLYKLLTFIMDIDTQFDSHVTLMLPQFNFNESSALESKMPSSASSSASQKGSNESSSGLKTWIESLSEDEENQNSHKNSKSQDDDSIEQLTKQEQLQGKVKKDTGFLANKRRRKALKTGMIESSTDDTVQNTSKVNAEVDDVIHTYDSDHKEDQHDKVKIRHRPRNSSKKDALNHLSGLGLPHTCFVIGTPKVIWAAISHEPEQQLRHFQALVFDEIDRMVLTGNPLGKFDKLKVRKENNWEARKLKKPAVKIIAAKADADSTSDARQKYQFVFASATVGRPLRRALAGLLKQSPKDGVPYIQIENRQTRRPLPNAFEVQHTSLDESGTHAECTDSEHFDLLAELMLLGYQPRVRNKNFDAQVTRNVTVPSNIEHFYTSIPEDDIISKCDMLSNMLVHLKPRRCLVLIPEKDSVSLVVQQLQDSGFTSAVALHNVVGFGSGEHLDIKSLFSRTDQLMTAYDTSGRHDKGHDHGEAGNFPILVTGQPTARGLHLERLDVVFLLGATADPDEYQHFAGRTGRNGYPGSAFQILSYTEARKLSPWSSYLNVLFYNVPYELFDQEPIIR